MRFVLNVRRIEIITTYIVAADSEEARELTEEGCETNSPFYPDGCPSHRDKSHGIVDQVPDDPDDEILSVEEISDKEWKEMTGKEPQ